MREALDLGVVGRALVVCPPPVEERGELGPIFEGAAGRCVGLPDQMERFAVENGAAYFDAGTVIAVDPLDGVHWSVESHAILGRAVAPVAKGMLA